MVLQNIADAQNSLKENLDILPDISDIPGIPFERSVQAIFRKYTYFAAENINRKRNNRALFEIDSLGISDFGIAPLEVKSSKGSVNGELRTFIGTAKTYDYGELFFAARTKNHKQLLELVDELERDEPIRIFGNAVPDNLSVSPAGGNLFDKKPFFDLDSDLEQNFLAMSSFTKKRTRWESYLLYIMLEESLLGFTKFFLEKRPEPDLKQVSENFKLYREAYQNALLSNNHGLRLHKLWKNSYDHKNFSGTYASTLAKSKFPQCKSQKHALEGSWDCYKYLSVQGVMLMEHQSRLFILACLLDTDKQLASGLAVHDVLENYDLKKESLEKKFTKIGEFKKRNPDVNIFKLLKIIQDFTTIWGGFYRETELPSILDLMDTTSNEFHKALELWDLVFGKSSVHTWGDGAKNWIKTFDKTTYNTFIYLPAAIRGLGLSTRRFHSDEFPGWRSLLADMGNYEASWSLAFLYSFVAEKNSSLFKNPVGNHISCL